VSSWIDMVFILVVVIDLFTLASSRLNAAIRAVALQGALLSVLPLLLASWEREIGHVLVLSLGALAIKAILIPWLMFRAIREAAIRREVEPIIGFVPSMILGGVGVALAFAFSRGLPLPSPERPYIRFKPIAPGEAVELNGRIITALPARHAVPCIGYQLDSGKASLVYSGDTTYCEEFWQALNRIPKL